MGKLPIICILGQVVSLVFLVINMIRRGLNAIDIATAVALLIAIITMAIYMKKGEQ